MSLKPKVFGLVSAGLATAIIAFFTVAHFNSDQATGSSSSAPKITALAASITVTPTSAVPNASVAIVGTGFTPASTAGGAGPDGVHQITGTGTSLIKIAETSLGSPHITYPINLDTGGNFVATAVVPVSATTLSTGSMNVVATDDKAITATTTLTVPSRTLKLDPATGRRGTTLTATGAGFPANNPGITVPNNVAIPSSNTITASLVGQTATATATHSVPAASISVVPAESAPGSSVTVSGSNFPAFSPVSTLKIGTVPVLPSPGPSTDTDGVFSSDVLVPGLPTGNQVVLATIGGVSAVATFKITAPLIAPTATPTPTPTPSPVIGSAVALAPLLDTDNLVRVWNFSNSTKTWAFFDPRPAFAPANTITGLSSGQVYWIKVLSDQTPTLNGRQRVLTAGWNVISW